MQPGPAASAIQVTSCGMGAKTAPRGADHLVRRGTAALPDRGTRAERRLHARWRRPAPVTDCHRVLGRLRAERRLFAPSWPMLAGAAGAQIIHSAAVWPPAGAARRGGL